MARVSSSGWRRGGRAWNVPVVASVGTMSGHGPDASVVIQPLIQAMCFGQTAHDVATKQYWIHPSLPEVVENALLALPSPAG